MSLFIHLTLVLSLSSTAFAGDNLCELCTKADALKNSAHDDAKKAAHSLAELMSNVKLSEKKEVRSQEYESLLAAAGYLAASDERREIPQYLVDLEEESPADFKAAFSKIPYSQQKELKPMMEAARKMFDKGEEE